MNSMMTGTVEVGTARKAAFAWPSAGKTGTSQNSRDAWFVGYTAELTTGVWFGNDDGKPMKNVTGGALPTMAWHAFMAAAHKGKPLPLPGNWRAGPDLVDPAVPDQGQIVAAPADDTAAPQPARAPAPVPAAAVRQELGADEPTASIGHPVPKADVGGPRVKRETSILDIIMGDGG
jgi:penicillin-binding protein 1A